METGAEGGRRRVDARSTRRRPAPGQLRGGVMQLRELAHARTGDKGDTSQISVIAYEEGDYTYLAEHVTPERVRMHLAAVVRGEVVRYELPGLGALNFVMDRAL